MRRRCDGGARLAKAGRTSLGRRQGVLARRREKSIGAACRRQGALDPGTGGRAPGRGLRGRCGRGRVALVADGLLADAGEKIGAHFVSAAVKRFAFDDFDNAVAWAEKGSETGEQETTNRAS